MTEQFLKANGFLKVYPDDVDKEYFYWRFDIKHKLLTGLHIIVDQTISVYAKEPSNKINGRQNGDSNEVLLIFKEKNKENLAKILKFCASL